jgi:hypothetical protein
VKVGNWPKPKARCLINKGKVKAYKPLRKPYISYGKRDRIDRGKMEESGQEKTRVVNLAKNREGLAETVGELLGFNDERCLWLILNRHRADLGRCCAQLNSSHRHRIFPLLAGELAADVLAELDMLTMFDVAEGDLSGLVEAVEPDDAADLLVELRTEELERVLSLIPVQEAEPAGTQPR